MTTLEVDFSRLPFEDGIRDPKGDYANAPRSGGIIPREEVYVFPVKRCVGYPWKLGDKFDFSKIYGGQADSRKLLLISTSGSTNNKIYFDDGLILETNRSSSSQTKFGEGIGIAFDISQAPPTSSIRIEVEFDYLAVSTAEYFDPRSTVKPEVDKESTVPLNPPTGMKFAISRLVQLIRDPRSWIRDDLTGVVPGTTGPFFGTVSALCTAKNLITGTIDIQNDTMATAVVQVSYDPDDSGTHTQQIRIAVPGESGKPTGNNTHTIDKMDFPFFVERFRCPIKKMSSWLYKFFREPWTGNPRFSYSFQFKMEVSEKNSPNDDALIGMRLLRAAPESGDVFDELNGKGGLEFSVKDGPPDTSQYTAMHFMNNGFSGIKFAGASLQIGKPKTTNPAPNFGPARVRIKRLLVEYA